MIFLAFPSGCNTFRGPHPDVCLATVFVTAGCIEDGLHYPTNLPANERQIYDQLTFWWVSSYNYLFMNLYWNNYFLIAIRALPSYSKKPLIFIFKFVFFFRNPIFYEFPQT